MITKDNKDFVQHAMEFALKNGCNASKVVLYSATDSTFEIRDKKIERLMQSDEFSLGISLYVDGKFGSCSTNRLDKKEVEDLILRSITATRYLATDEARKLPDASRYFKGGNNNDLDSIDPDFNNVSPDKKKELAMKVCDEIMGKDPRIISATSSYEDEILNKYMITSNGFEGEEKRSYYGLNGGVSIKGEGDARPESSWYDVSVYLNDLQKEGIGKEALKRVLRKLGAHKIESGNYRVVVDNVNSARLLSPILDSLDGQSIQQHDSFLIDCIDKKVFGDNFTLKDEPFLKRARGARYYDNEGVATRPMTVIDKGVLKTYYIDTYAANKMKVAPTIASASVLTMPGGVRNCEELIAELDKGVLITGFNGGNCNSTTGDFSYGIEGFLIENGKTTQPINEMNVTGNMKTLWSHLAEVGSDPKTTSSYRIPSLLFENVSLSGL